MLESLAKINASQIGEKILDWLHANILNVSTVYQSIMIAAAFIFARILYGIFRNGIQNAIDKSTLTFKTKRILRSLQKLIFPLMAVVTIFFLIRILGSEMVGMNVGLTTGVTKVLWAWIFIRIVVQYIDHAAIRNFFALAIWCIAALSIFDVLDETMETLDALGITIGTFNISALLVLKGALYLFILLYIANFSAALSERYILNTHNMTRSTQILVSKIIRITLIVFAILIGITSSGIDLSLFAVFGGAIGIGVGLGLQRGVSNLFSGLLLLLDRSIQPGDIIELENGKFGWVKTMGGRHTEIVTGDNKSYLIPNEEFANQRVINWSHGDNMIGVSLDFGVHYKSDPHEVIRIAINAASKPKRILKEQPPTCFVTGFGDSAINFTLGFWIRDAENGLKSIRGEVFLALWDAFKENGIEIPYPHRDVYVHQV